MPAANGDQPVCRVGLAYRLYRSGGLQEGGSDQYRLACLVVEGGGTDDLFGPVGESWISLEFRLRPTRGWLPSRFDASSTYGLFGGVGDATQKMVSEAVERNLGDVIVHLLCKYVDSRAVEPAGIEIWCLGPALPKVVGRLASLRLPSEWRVRWYTPNPLPNWYQVFPSIYRLQPGTGVLAEPAADQALVRSTSYSHPSCLVQELSLYGDPASERQKPGSGPASWEGRGVRLPQPLRYPTLVLSVGTYHDPLIAARAEGALEVLGHMKEHLQREGRTVEESKLKDIEKTLLGSVGLAARSAGRDVIALFPGRALDQVSGLFDGISPQPT